MSGEKRGWVNCVAVKRGEWIRCNNNDSYCCTNTISRSMWETDLPSGHEMWTGCPSCDNAAPHLAPYECSASLTFPDDMRRIIGDDEARTRERANAIALAAGGDDGQGSRRVSTTRDTIETPFGIFVCDIDFAEPNDETAARDEMHKALEPAMRPLTAMLDGIASESDLARAMFVANNLDEIERRGEVDDRFATREVHAARWRQTLSTAWTDPHYAKERAECEKAAGLVWRARRVCK